MRFNNRDEIQIGALVVFNDLPDATVFEVTEHVGTHGLKVREAGTSYAEQYVDACQCLKPTAWQLETNGIAVAKA